MEGAEREWWRRVPRVLAAPREVFAALRNDDPDDVVARQEPVLLLVLLVGMAGVVMSPRWSTLLDEPDVDGWLIVAVLTFIAGGLYGAVGYFLLTGCQVFEARSVVELLMHHTETEPTPPSRRTDRPVPADLEALILQCLEKSPERRPASAAALRDALAGLTDAAAWTETEARSWWGARRTSLAGQLAAR